MRAAIARNELSGARTAGPWRAAVRAVRSLAATDARHLQITALGTLLIVLQLRNGPGIVPWQPPVCLGGVLLAQAVCCRIAGAPFDWRSPVITGLSLSLLLRAQTPWLWLVACVLAIGSKFVLRLRGKHVFNPANFAIASLLLLSPQVWVAPGQWGTSLWLAGLFSALALAVLGRAGRIDIAAAFGLAYGGLLVWRCLTLGDPLTIPAHQVQSGALLLFTFFMITDPRATPDRAAARIVFALAVAALTYWLQFRWQVRPAPFLALFALSPLVPVLDRLLPAPRFAWSAA